MNTTTATLTFTDLWRDDTIHTVTIRTERGRYVTGTVVGLIEGDARTRQPAAVDVETAPDREPVRLYTTDIRTIWRGRVRP